MQNEIPLFLRVYYGAFAILLASIAFLVTSIASLTVSINHEIKSIRLILQNDYAYASENATQEDGQDIGPEIVQAQTSQRTE